MKRTVIISLILLALFSSCKKDNTPAPATDVTPVMARDSLYYLMQWWYYWYKEMPAVNKDSYSDPYTLMDTMMYKTFDKWSFVADYNQFISEMQGAFVGHGIRIGVDDAGKARIAEIYNLSPLYAQGVRRGWMIKSVNGTDIAPLIISGDQTAYNNVMGASQAGVTNTFVFTKPDGTDIEISSTKSSFTINSVILYDTLHLSTGVAGHLVFDSFIEPSTGELATAFAYFSSVNIENLILDLRYNTGGYLYVAQELASYIAGNSVNQSSIFAKLSYNDKNQDQNVNYTFKTTTTPMAVPRLVVITSRLTASASEAVINGLKPWKPVVCIGDTTYGKPVGMNGWPIAEKYYFWPVTFKIVNSNNEGDYFGGIPVDKVVTDDVTHDFSDRRELCLAEAIHYLETGSVSAKKSAAPFHRNVQVTEKPAWMNNAFDIKR
ncbi:MAG: S41 family peptidase [Bacteroidales bacterium]